MSKTQGGSADWDAHERDAVHYVNCGCALVAIRTAEMEVVRLGQEAGSLAQAMANFSERLEAWERSEYWTRPGTSRWNMTLRNLKRSALLKLYLTKRWARATRLWTALTATVNGWKPLTRKPKKSLSRFRKYQAANPYPWSDQLANANTNHGRAAALATELFGLAGLDEGVELQSTIHSEVFYRFDFVHGAIGVRSRFADTSEMDWCFFFDSVDVPMADGMIAAALLAASDEKDFFHQMKGIELHADLARHLAHYAGLRVTS